MNFLNIPLFFLVFFLGATFNCTFALFIDDDDSPPEKYKISGGITSTLGEFPFLALLGYRVENGIEFKCGGSLITSRYVLTAAHCVTNTLVFVRLGEYIIDQYLDCSWGERCPPPAKDFSIETKIRHSQYNIREMVNDIALLRLNESASLQNKDHINTIALAPNETWNYLFVSGWGATESQIKSETLMKAMVPVQPIQTCIDIYKIDYITDQNSICAGGENLVDTCKGDSGGPLFSPITARSPPMLFGIIASGYKQCGVTFRNKTMPALYTKVANYVDWIYRNIY